MCPSTCLPIARMMTRWCRCRTLYSDSSSTEDRRMQRSSHAALTLSVLIGRARNRRVEALILVGG
jgi:hypothetical protein